MAMANQERAAAWAKKAVADASKKKREAAAEADSFTKFNSLEQ
jgi:hypothetical protein